ncbi:Pnt1p ASCRUDRAFT_8298 [Ascoidea rubescens DSM 1968]|uniref:Letm1 RBD domain-containing protein n=1 Tax=Ascoidea rubescens DSM 1968 TaxID=1344418 RepID=A0A1D2VGL5_9ASCO|nr:hypothetical protein ASCRUDRAFT_8298 [Ascoidea rubescens DSM 1968]ODV60690.1 hypothetical protein ASCRUDRAFT_8298 [Ascoidea rubescens DSM 1968]
MSIIYKQNYIANLRKNTCSRVFRLANSKRFNNTLSSNILQTTYNSNTINNSNNNTSNDRQIDTDNINIPSTLSEHIFSKDQFFNHLKLNNPEKLKFKWLHFLKYILTFYKNGISSIINNKHLLNFEILNNFYYNKINYRNVNHVYPVLLNNTPQYIQNKLSPPQNGYDDDYEYESDNNNSNNRKKALERLLQDSIVIKHFNSTQNIKLFKKNTTIADLNHYLINEISISNIELTTLNKSKSQQKNFKVLNIKRNQYQLMLRTFDDLNKFYTFMFVTILFEEITPLIFYFFPGVFPNTCLLDFIQRKTYLNKYRSNNHTALLTNLNNILLNKKSIYQLNKREIVSLINSLNISLNSNILNNLPKFIIPIEILRDNLLNFKNEILIDNYLISTEENGVHLMNLDELFLACFKRGLIQNDQEINLINKIFKHNSQQELENDLTNLDVVKDLRSKLSKFIQDTKFK